MKGRGALTDEQIAEIVLAPHSDAAAETFARRFGRHPGTIRKYQTGESKAALRVMFALGIRSRRGDRARTAEVAALLAEDA